MDEDDFLGLTLGGKVASLNLARIWSLAGSLAGHSMLAAFWMVRR